MGARPETLMGLSGLGDLVLTASSPQSRNFSYGLSLGEGGARTGALVEGIETALVTRDLAAKLGVDMPIVGAVAGVLSEKLTIPEAIAALMSRPLKRED
jgi:glycerol-3-phosphate dehydrogenase (NAD(P)+)